MGGWSGIVDGEVVTTGWLGTPLLDNLDRANLAVTTIDGHRRRGYASAMLAHVEQVARDRGRTMLGGEAYWAYDAGPEGPGSPGREFARAHGYELALGDVQRRLALPVADDLLDELAAEAAGHHAAYTLRSWVGPVPEELVAEIAEMDAALMTEAPTGELTIEPQAADVAALREGEQLLAKQGRTKYSTVALDADGHAAAYTDLVTTIHEPDRAYQWGTLVLRADRGHRLGLAVKIANLQLLQRERPDLRQVTDLQRRDQRPHDRRQRTPRLRPRSRAWESSRRSSSRSRRWKPPRPRAGRRPPPVAGRRPHCGTPPGSPARGR